MLKAFRALGYEVAEVTGYSAERREKMRAVKKMISDGAEFDFLYAENTNDPVALADADHIPRHPFMDFSFFKYCKRHGIPVGLFYRDIYWKFPVFKSAASLPKRMVLTPLFRYDVMRYKKLLDVMFLPTEMMRQFVIPDINFAQLPPGGDPDPDTLSERLLRTPAADGKLHIFYVGSLTGYYDCKKLFEAVKMTGNVYLTACVPKNQWETVNGSYAPYMCDRIRIVHKSASELAPYYIEADIFACCLKNDPYLDMAMPLKLFESISYGTPVLATDIRSISEFVEENGIGWVTGCGAENIAAALERLKNDPAEISEKTKNTVTAAGKNTWRDRAARAAEILTEIKNTKYTKNTEDTKK